MFGRLTHDGVAVVVSCSQAAHSVVVKSGGYTRCRFDLVVDVYPDGAPPFRTEITEWFARMLSPKAGDQLRARCNPDKRKVLLQSISEAAATAPGWSTREPVFFPEWVEKVEA